MNEFSWTVAEVEKALGLSSSSDGAATYARVSTDTRSVQPGDLFVALKGERFDAHDLLDEAARAGATGAVVSRLPEDAPRALRYFQVPDTLRALGALGRHRRDRLDARVVAVVGSNGKTTTKDLIRAALQARFRVHATEGNLNNQIGVPLTLLAAPQEAEVLVVEMGTNEPGEIEILTAIVRPDAAVITSIGEEHLEKLGNLEGVLEEEISVLRGLAPGGVALVAEEPAQLPERARELLGADRVRVAGFSAAADLRPEQGLDGVEVLPDGTTRWRWRGRELRLPLPGRFHVRNALLALGLASEWEVDEEAAVRAVESSRAAKMRGEWRQIRELRVLADCYNSNPPSAAAAVDLLASLPASGPKVAVLGTMRELGGAAEELHARLAADVAERVGQGIDLVVATGAFVPAFAPLQERLGDRLVACADPVEAYARVSERLEGRETVLLKASRGEALERWIPLLEKDFG